MYLLQNLMPNVQRGLMYQEHLSGIRILFHQNNNNYCVAYNYLIAWLWRPNVSIYHNGRNHFWQMTKLIETNTGELFSFVCFPLSQRKPSTYPYFHSHLLNHSFQCFFPSHHQPLLPVQEADKITLRTFKLTTLKMSIIKSWDLKIKLYRNWRRKQL